MHMIGNLCKHRGTCTLVSESLVKQQASLVFGCGRGMHYDVGEYERADVAQRAHSELGGVKHVLLPPSLSSFLPSPSAVLSYTHMHP